MANDSKFQYTIKADGSKPKFKEKVSEKNLEIMNSMKKKLK